MPEWVRSSFCSANSCIEVLHANGKVYLRTSAAGGVMTMLEASRDEIDAFVKGWQAGEFDAPTGMAEAL
jgi:hypothetical protein